VCPVFLDCDRFGADACAQQARDHVSKDVFECSRYKHDVEACKHPRVRVPACMYDQRMLTHKRSLFWILRRAIISPQSGGGAAAAGRPRRRGRRGRRPARPPRAPRRRVAGG
jgi:hypothetical protein